MSRNDAACRLLIVGNDGGTNIGASLLRAAAAIGLAATLCDARRAYAGSRTVARINWWLRGRRPSGLESFSREVVETSVGFQPSVLLATGLAPVDRHALERIRLQGVETMNYLTDDPWNPAFRSAWFLEALGGYDRVFSVRTRNIDDLTRAGCRRVDYLPFGVDPELFFPQDPGTGELDAYRSDVCFAGGADRDRVPLIAALIEAGLDVAVYGDYWGRYAATRHAWRGHANPETLRKATCAARVSLCLVRRANRDGHTMRSFEVPTIGGCMLAEDTDEHRAFFGPDDRAVCYFDSIESLVDGAKSLVRDDERRRRLARAAHQLIVAGGHTYRDRLQAMIENGPLDRLPLPHVALTQAATDSSLSHRSP